MHGVADVLALDDQRPPAFEPGTKLVYDNFGYVVLGRMVEVLSGEDYESYVCRHIFAPAGMTHTGFVDCTTHAPDLAVGYTTVDGKRVSNCRCCPCAASQSAAKCRRRGTCTGSRGCWNRASCFRRCCSPRRPAPIANSWVWASLQQAMEPGVPASDFRWGHGGSADGICVDARSYPHTGETVIVLSNRSPPICYPVANFLYRPHWAHESCVPAASRLGAMLALGPGDVRDWRRIQPVDATH